MSGWCRGDDGHGPDVTRHSSGTPAGNVDAATFWSPRWGARRKYPQPRESSRSIRSNSGSIDSSNFAINSGGGRNSSGTDNGATGADAGDEGVDDLPRKEVWQNKDDQVGKQVGTDAAFTNANEARLVEKSASGYLQALLGGPDTIVARA